MIAYIKGILTEISEQSVILESGGIGYYIAVSQKTLVQMPKVGQEIKLLTYFGVREDAMFLYGFLYKEELNLFQMLVSVRGISHKSAIAILSVMTPADIIYAIILDDVSKLTTAPGIGKKTAQRIILELKDKIKNHDAVELVSAQQTVSSDAPARKEAIEALLALGYGRGEAVNVVYEITQDQIEMKTEQILKLALKKLVRI